MSIEIKFSLLKANCSLNSPCRRQSFLLAKKQTTNYFFQMYVLLTDHNSQLKFKEKVINIEKNYFVSIINIL